MANSLKSYEVQSFFTSPNSTAGNCVD